MKVAIVAYHKVSLWYECQANGMIITDFVLESFPPNIHLLPIAISVCAYYDGFQVKS